MTDHVFQLVGTCNSYPWGKTGRDSIAAQLCAKTDSNFSIQHDKPYSELWFGDYPDFPPAFSARANPFKTSLTKTKTLSSARKSRPSSAASSPTSPR